MNEDKQRIAIAEACGWEDSGTCYGWKNKITGKWHFKEYLPNYLNDLNAMHDAEKTLKSNGDYLHHLMTATNSSIRCEMNLELLVGATAAQRAEAFLRAIGKWEEDT